ncbi:hypothetical protein A8C75_20040 [Marinobacterium aestuarii]|uniref:Putative Flp pilus-assembly TadG-like N-terminal domain-containing protein n=2 Tax=Marinobacterium aestuarii TaxID=1821621 RepID=A0A1A9F2K2_9GAMM|nr:hypothetical protein A8C75_20040 [Marinobacterium aestuarii]
MYRRTQKGAIGLSAVLLLLSVVMLAAVVIDTARLFFAQRELQTQADLAALAMSRGVCYVDGVNARAALEAEAQANLVLNGFDLEQGSAAFTYGGVGIEDSHWTLDTEGVDYQPGARVSLTRALPASLVAGGLWGGQVQLGASAAVYKRMAVGFGIGSGLLDVDLTNSLLGALLGGELNVLSYNGLASSRLSLGSLLAAMDANGLLAADLAVGTVDEALASNIALADLVEASIDALNAQGTADVEAIDALTELENVARVGGLSLTLSDLLRLSTATDEGMGGEIERAALATEINLYGLVSGAVMASNQNHFIEVPGLDVDLGIAGLSVGLTIIEPPQYTFGLLPAAADDDWVAQVETAQVELDVKAALLPGGLSLGIPLLLNLSLNPGTLGIHVDVAKARTRLLDAPVCNWSAPQLQLEFETAPSVANLTVGDDPEPEIEASVNVLGLFGSLLTVGIDIEASVPESSQSSIEHSFTLGGEALPSDPPERVNAPLGKTLDATLDEMTLDLNVILLDGALNSLLGLSLDYVLDEVLGLVKEPVLDVAKPLVVTLVGDVVEPLLQALGITVGYADVIVESVDMGKSNLIE